MPGNVTTTTAAVFIPEIWSKEVLVATEKNLVLAKSVMRLDKYVKGGGDMIHIPMMANIAARDKASGTAITYDNATELERVLNITAHKYAAFKLEDIARVQADTDLMQRYTGRIGYATALAADSSIATEMVAGFASTVGSSASTTARLALTFITAAARFLDLADAVDSDRVIAIDAYGAEQLRNIDSFTRYDARGKNFIEDGMIGEIFGFKVQKTNVVGAATTVAANVATGFAFQKEAAAFALQKTSVESEYSVDDFAWKVASQSIYGTKVARTDHGVKLYYGIG